MDLAALGFEIAVEGSLAVTGALLLLTYVAFTRMNRDVRRARLFIMADRVKRFLGAFTFGFLLIAIASIMTIGGLPTAATVFAVVIFLFLAAIVYGSLELFLIVRPRPTKPLSFRKRGSRRTPTEATAATVKESSEGEIHAAR